MARHEPLALVIFDCDGVLVDSEPIASRTMAEHLTALGYPMTPEQCVERFTGVSLKTVMSRIEADWGRSLPEDFVPSLRERDFAAFAADLKSIEGVAEAVAELAVPVCVASSGAMAKMRFTLESPGCCRCSNPTCSPPRTYRSASRRPTCSSTPHGIWGLPHRRPWWWWTASPGFRRRGRQGCGCSVSSVAATRDLATQTRCATLAPTWCSTG